MPKSYHFWVISPMLISSKRIGKSNQLQLEFNVFSLGALAVILEHGEQLGNCRFLKGTHNILQWHFGISTSSSSNQYLVNHIISYPLNSTHIKPTLLRCDCLAELLASESFFKSVSNASKRPVSFSLVSLSFRWSNDTWKSFNDDNLKWWMIEWSLHPHSFTGPSFFH